MSFQSKQSGYWDSLMLSRKKIICLVTLISPDNGYFPNSHFRAAPRSSPLYCSSVLKPVIETVATPKYIDWKSSPS